MNALDAIKEQYPGKFLSEERIFESINRGDRLYLESGCGEPQYLIQALVNFVESNPSRVIETELLNVMTLGVAPYTDPKYQRNFRYNSFFIGNNARDAVNRGLADYTPMFLSQVPALFNRGLISLDVALIQCSPPDKNGYMSLGINVDITRAAIENAPVVICQINSEMPFVHGDTVINIKNVDFAVCHDEPLLERDSIVPGDLGSRIGKHVSRIIEDGDTLQVGYGNVPNAILANLNGKKHLGIHTELLTDGIVELMKSGAVDNSRKSVNRGKTIASLCMGKKSTYQFLDDNPAFEFKPIDYTNNPLIIAKHENMTAINTALAIDLTGQASAESFGGFFYSGVGGQADFMRGTIFAPGGKTILALASTSNDGKSSKIVPYLYPGSKVTLTTGDIHYVVTEYGTAYLNGKSLRARAMELISIAHPDFRPWLIKEAKRLRLIYEDQLYIPGKEGEYPEELERYRTTGSGLEILLRPVKISDEPLLKDFFYSLSDESNYKRFLTLLPYMPHKVLQKLSSTDYEKQMVILAVVEEEEKQTVVGVGQYVVLGDTNTAEFAVAIRDEYQKSGVGTQIFLYLIEIAKREGIHGFSGDFLAENRGLDKLLKKAGLPVAKELSSGVAHFDIPFRT